MRHPFELEISALEAIALNAEDELTDEETVLVAGGGTLTTEIVGEEGGSHSPPNKHKFPPITDYATLCGNEEGGGFPPLPF